MALSATLIGGAGCALFSPPPAPAPRVVMSEPQIIEVEVFRKAETERAASLALEVERLRADLRQAEDALVMAESGLRESHSRADAVSRLAEARIQVARAGKLTPWRHAEFLEASNKLEEATQQLEQSHYGAALFFVYRAQRIAGQLESEAKAVAATPGTRFVKTDRANLRSGPAIDNEVLTVLSEGTPVFAESHKSNWVLVRTTRGQVGWLHRSLIGPR